MWNYRVFLRRKAYDLTHLGSRLPTAPGGKCGQRVLVDALWLEGRLQLISNNVSETK